MNRAIIIGRLGKDPEIRNTQSGSSVASFSVATDHSIKNESNEWKQATEWHNIVVFGKRAEFAEQYLQKGKLVYIEGRLHTNSWEDQNGQKHYKTEIIAADIQLLGSKSEGPEQQLGEKYTQQTNLKDDFDMGDVPF